MIKEAKIYIVRHAESEGNARKVISGYTDHKLTLTGEAQAIKLGKKLNHIKFDRVFSSDLIRAQRTAELITFEKQLAITTTQALRERNFGRLEGKASSELHTLFGSWNKLPHKEQLKQRPDRNTESTEETISRFITFLREVAIRHQGKTVLIATHGGLMYSFLIHLGFAKDQEIKRIENTALILVESDGINFKIKDMEGVVVEHESESLNN